MSKSNPYPTHFKDQPKTPKGYDKNAPGSQGGVENLPNQQFDDPDEASEYGGKGWSPDYSQYQ
jgi:hypothetical protein